jgi:hypothetical protein
VGDGHAQKPQRFPETQLGRTERILELPSQPEVMAPAAPHNRQI